VWVCVCLGVCVLQGKWCERACQTRKRRSNHTNNINNYEIHSTGVSLMAARTLTSAQYAPFNDLRAAIVGQPNQSVKFDKLGFVFLTFTGRSWNKTYKRRCVCVLCVCVCVVCVCCMCVWFVCVCCV